MPLPTNSGCVSCRWRRSAERPLPVTPSAVGLAALTQLMPGTPLIDEAGSTFLCAEHFARLSALGWVDVWRHFHGDVTEYTWYSLPKGGAPASGFRLDHAFATPSLLPRITACRYSHAEREQKVSDHSPLILEIK